MNDNDLNHLVEFVLLPQGHTCLSALYHCKNCVCKYVMNEPFFQFQKPDLRIMEEFFFFFFFKCIFIPEYLHAYICYIFNIACII